MAQSKKVPVFIAKAMNNCGATQKEIGGCFGVSQSTVSRKMKDENK